jgi:hypothetical protein
MTSTIKNKQHISAIDFHLYSVGAITGFHLTVFEDHLLSCMHCHAKATEALRSVREKIRDQENPCEANALGTTSSDVCDPLRYGKLNSTWRSVKNARIGFHLSKFWSVWSDQEKLGCTTRVKPRGPTQAPGH